MVALCVLSFLGGKADAQVNLRSGELSLDIDAQGYFSDIKIGSQNILSKPATYPLLIACRNGQLVYPKSLRQKNNILTLTFTDGKVATLRTTCSNTSLTFEIATFPTIYNAAIICPVAVTLTDMVGDIIGVAQGKGLAFGIQSLNTKTNAGIPDEYASPFTKKFYLGSGSTAELSTGTIESSRLAAVDFKDFSLFQFSCRNRSKLEYRRVNNLDHMMVLPVKGQDALVDGTKIAIFGCASSQALARIGQIEVEHHLPHPMFDGEWGKTARAAMKSYLISDFNEDNLDFIMEKAQRAGFKYIYHSGPFEDWGHFNFSKSFTKNGDEGVRQMVQRAAAKGLKLGVHTLSNFTTTNDAYVTPVPSAHLLKQGALQLTAGIDDKQTELSVRRSSYFSLPLTLNALQIDNELITYSSVDSSGTNMILKGCQRGAFNTKAVAHSKGTPLYKLWDYPYRTLFPDIELQDNFADRLAKIFNYTGLCQISFDGLEGCRYTGHEDYATARFVYKFWNQINHNIVNDASNLSHFTWHIHSRMNWGEPWGEEMRTGQVKNRIKNQEFFKRNLFPRMLGWFLIRLADRKFECSTLEDLEWALSESAGFDAGYAMTIQPTTLKKHGQIDQLLDAIKNWDLLREKLAFTPEQMERLKDPSTEWHLEKINETHFKLYPLHISSYYHCDLGELQPGQPGGSDWSWSTPYEGKFAIRLKVEGGAIKNPSFRTSSGVIKFPCIVNDKQYLLYHEDGSCEVTDQNYNKLQDVTPEGSATLPKGDSSVAFSCEIFSDQPPFVSVRHITRGVPENILIK